MDRLVFAALLIALLLLIPARGCVSPDAEEAQSVFFSMLFPQLTPGAMLSDEESVEATAAEAMYL
ncbi:MAG: hypothetical protein Q4F18_06805 [Clostridia bacterium]|nr:hypothetical protein [Clostridia bacterium]